jgi:hypothetical protein
MTTPRPPGERLSDLLLGPPRPVLAVTDELLDLCQLGDVSLAYDDAQVQATVSAGGCVDRLSAPLRRSVFRAVLARVAALCNEFAPDSVSPYGGDGRLVLPGNPPVVRAVSFRNTPGEQWLTVSSPAGRADGEGRPAGASGRVEVGLAPAPAVAG